MAKLTIGYPPIERPVLARFTVSQQQYDRDNLDLLIEPVYIAEDDDKLIIHRFSDYREEQAFQDLLVTAYLRIRARYESDVPFEIWGGPRIEYRQPYSVQTDRAVIMAKKLQAIDAKVRKLDDSEGYTSDYALRAIRVLKAIGCEGLAVQTEWGLEVKPLGELTNLVYRAIRDARKDAGIED